MPEHLAKMPYNDKRKLVESVFDGKDAKGHRLGVYVNRTELGVTFTINGHLPDLQIRGNLPISEADWVDLLKLDPDYQDIAKEINDFKSYIPSSGENMLQILT